MTQDGQLEDGDVVVNFAGTMRLSVWCGEAGVMRQISLNDCVLYGGENKHITSTETYLCNVKELFKTIGMQVKPL